MSKTISGSCLCGGVRYEVDLPFTRANYCHCTRCAKGSGSWGHAQGRIPRAQFRLLEGEALIKIWRPECGAVKAFCTDCGSSLFGAQWPDGDEISVRLGTLDGNPEITPQYHSFVEARLPWVAIPEDGLDRYPGPPPN